jgi:hypothetical protein
MSHDDYGVIFLYSRAQAIADGILIDVSGQARESGFRVPVALSAAVWADCIAWSEEDSRRQTPQDETGRLWDVLCVARWTIFWCKEPENPMLFDVKRIPRDGRSTTEQLVTLKFELGLGDHDEPVGTIMQPHEV